MNTVVIYFSKFGHTQRIAETIAEALRSAGSVALIAHDKLEPDQLIEADLVVMGTPTHRMNLPDVVRPLFERLPRKILRGKAVAAFDTSYKMSDRDSPAWLARFTAAPKLARKLRKLGGKLIASPETFFVKDREGPLYEGEIERAGRWATSLESCMHSREKRGGRRVATAAEYKTEP